MYEMGTPDVLSVIVGSSGYEDLVDRAEYLDRIHGMDEAVVGRVRDLRDQVKRTVDAPARRQGPDRSRPRRDRRRRAGAGQRPRRRAEPPGGAGRRARPSAMAALAKIRATRGRAGRLGRRDPGQDRRPAGGDRLGAAAGGPDPGRQRQRPDLAGRRPGRLRLRAAHDQRQLRVPPGDRHRRAERHADPRRGRRHRDLHRARGRAAAATATTPASTTAAGSPPATPTRSPSRSPPGQSVRRAR